MSRESDFATRMQADTALMAALTGGVFTSAGVGREGITRETAPTAFDANGYLKPCALVRQRGITPDGIVYDGMMQVTSVRQVVEIWLYQDGGYTSIDTAVNRLYQLFQGYVMSGTHEIRLAGVLDRQRDPGALAGASLVRLDWQIDSVIGD